MRWGKTKIIKIGVSLVLALGLAILVGNKFLIAGTFVVNPEAQEEIALLPGKIGQAIVDIKDRARPEFPYVRMPLIPPPEPPAEEEPPQPTATPPTGFLPNPTDTPWPTATLPPGTSPTPTRIPTAMPTATPPPVFTPTPPRSNITVEEFARCLTQKGMKMYGTNGCGACRSQINMFGAAFSYISFTDCNQQSQVCNNEGITRYPTWKDSAGNKYVGAQSFSSLGQISGCQTPS